MRAGIVPVTARADRWTLEAKHRERARSRRPRDVLAAMLGLTTADLGTTPLWVDTGSEQLVIPLTSAEAVVRCAPDPALLLRHASLELPGPPGSARSVRAMAYVWSRADEGSVSTRFFFSKHGAVVEDPGTGSACANLGGWLVADRCRTASVVDCRPGRSRRTPLPARPRRRRRWSNFRLGPRAGARSRHDQTLTPLTGEAQQAVTTEGARKSTARYTGPLIADRTASATHARPHLVRHDRSRSVAGHPAKPMRRSPARSITTTRGSCSTAPASAPRKPRSTLCRHVARAGGENAAARPRAPRR